MRILMSLLILSIPPLIEVSSGSGHSADAPSPATRAVAAESRAPSIWMVPVVEAILIAGFALARRERQRLDVAAESAPAGTGRRRRRVAWHSPIH